jgi:hypothetical protein
MKRCQLNRESSLYLKDIVEDFCESLKNEPVLLDAIERIFTGYYKISKQIAKERLVPLVLQDKRLIRKVVALEGRKRNGCLLATQWIYHIEADENAMLDQILETHQQYRSEK